MPHLQMPSKQRNLTLTQFIYSPPKTQFKPNNLNQKKKKKNNNKIEMLIDDIPEIGVNIIFHRDCDGYCVNMNKDFFL